MTGSVKDRITNDLQSAKQEGGLRADRIRVIVKGAIAEAMAELKEGSGEIRALARDALSAVVEVLGDRAQTAQEELDASVQGVVEGISDTRRTAIAQTQAKLQELEAQINQQEQQLESDIDGALTELETPATPRSSRLDALIAAAINAVKNREELATLRQQYARLKGQLAILDANLAARYGDRYDDIKRHLDDAKTWYSNARTEAEATGTIPLEEKQSAIEAKLGEAGSAVARKERQLKQRLKELWLTATR